MHTAQDLNPTVEPYYIWGKVTDSCCNPVQGVTVVAKGSSQTYCMVTNACGIYAQKCVPCGCYCLTICEPGFECVKQTVKVSACGCCSSSGSGCGGGGSGSGGSGGCSGSNPSSSSTPASGAGSASS